MNTWVHAMRLLFGLSLLTVGCTAPPDRPSTELAEPSTIVTEVPVIPDEPSVAQEPSLVQEAPASEISGDVQERGVSKLAPGAFASGMAIQGVLVTPATNLYPGEFAFRTQKGYYLTAIGGGGRATDPTIITSATSAGPWEKFKLVIATPPSPHDKTVQTSGGNYVTAVGGGGRTSDVLHTDATQPRDWERFRLIDLGVGIPAAPTYYGIQTIKGRYLTAMGAGGKYQDAIHTDATQIKGWEQFRIVKCGDPGSTYEYGILAADGNFLTTSKGGGSSNYVVLSAPSGVGAKFKFFRQTDGTYAFQTENGVNYLTALGGGGQVQKYVNCDPGFFGACLSGFSTIFHTDATQVKSWEKFKVIDQGNCTYSIQTSSGFFMGIYKDSTGHMSLTTRRDGAPTPNEKFQLTVFGLASPQIIQ
ncbi:MAG: hypothetical protein P0111_10470 [Nitrospira sp.]|nr:hypothetical protein [Nitrospira sp.]